MGKSFFLNSNADNGSGQSSWGEPHYWQWTRFRCFWRVIGPEKGQPVLFLHGFGASSSHWRNNAGTFAQAGYRVFALDLIGFGRSDQPGLSSSLNGLDNEFWSNQVSSFLKEVVNIEINGQAILIGNSLGSLVALTTLASHPDYVSAVVAAPLPDPALINKINVNQNKFLLRLKDKLIRIFFRILPLELLLPIITRPFCLTPSIQVAYSRSISNDKDLIRIIARPAQRTSAAKALRAMCVGMFLRRPMITAPALLDRIEKQSMKKPFLLIWGRQDRLVPIKIGESLHQKHSWIDFLAFDSIGHCPHDESPRIFNENVLSWLDLHLKSQKQDL